MFEKVLKRTISARRVWDPNQVKRHPAGAPESRGGQFASQTGSYSGNGNLTPPKNRTGHVPGKTVSSNGAASKVFKALDEVGTEKELYDQLLSPEKAAEARALAAKADALIKDKQDTENLYREAIILPDGKRGLGAYSAERRRLHREIAREILSGINEDGSKSNFRPKEGETPRLLILGGRGGSGKSAFERLPGGYDKSKSLVLDADRIKQMLGAPGNKPEYEGWNAAQFHEESSYVMEMIAKHAMVKGYNVVLDITLKSPPKPGKTTFARMMMDYAAQAGYQVDGAYMSASRLKAQRNAVMRWANAKKNGRLVPVDVIAGNKLNEQNFDDLTPGFENWVVYDNNGANSDMMLVSSYQKGVLVDNSDQVIKSRRAYLNSSRIITKAFGGRHGVSQARRSLARRYRRSA